MRGHWLTLTVLVGMPASLAGQTADVIVRGELVALDNAWIKAEVNHDSVTLKLILDERFVATWPSGKTVGRDEFMAATLKSGIKPFTVIHDVIRVHGDAAVVLDLSEDRKQKYTWIALKEDGRWRVISETISRVAVPDSSYWRSRVQ